MYPPRVKGSLLLGPGDQRGRNKVDVDLSSVTKETRDGVRERLLLNVSMASKPWVAT